MPVKRGNSMSIIDVELVTIEVDGLEEIGLDTASSIKMNSETATTDAVKQIIKGVLKAQKPMETTVTGTTLVLTDNVFSPQLVKLLQGGEIETNDDGSIKSYTPLPTGASAADKQRPAFTLNTYSSIRNPAGDIEGYAKFSYPNCYGSPITLNIEDNAFSVFEYTINSYPDAKDPAFKYEVVSALPEVEDYYILNRED